MNRLTLEEKDRIRSALLDGMTVAQAAVSTGLSRGAVTTIAKHMRAEGIPVARAPQGRKPKVAA